MYYLGKGVEENDEETLKWFKLAADQGYAQALIHLEEYFNIKY